MRRISGNPSKITVAKRTQNNSSKVTKNIVVEGMSDPTPFHTFRKAMGHSWEWS